MSRPAALVLRVPAFPVRHGFTTTVLGSMGLTGSPEPEAVLSRRRQFAEEVGFDLGSAVYAVQVHGAQVATFRRAGPQRGAHSVLQTDALATEVPGQALLTYHADCFPLLFFDASRGVVAAAHAGWRGALAGIAAETVRTLRGTFGTRPDELHVLIGPGICRRCYEVGADLAGRFEERFGCPERYLDPDGERPHLDLAALAQLQLEENGVPGERVLNAGWCTREDPRWFSHRGARPGRFLAAVVAP